MQTEITPSSGAAAGTSRGRGVTLEDVKKAFEKLEAAGAPVNTRSVHAEVGRGSRSTICKHYATIQSARDVAGSGPKEAPPISPFVLRELAQEIDRVVKERTAHLAAELADVRGSLELVVQENEGFHAEAAEAESRVAALQASLAEHSGVSEALRSQIESLSKQLDAVHSEAESARQALALVREHLRASEERVGRLEAQEERARKELADAHRDGAELREHLEAKARECVSLQAQADSGRQLESRLEQSQAKVERLHAEREEARSRLAGAEAERSGLGERLKDAQDALSRAEATVQQLLRKLLEKAPEPQGGESK